jgi:hypothetical protein
VGARERGLGVGWVDAGEQPAVARGAHRHVAAHEEGEAAEHLLLGDGVLVGEQLAKAVG